jgi:uncharacterized protein (DUF2141 family)
MLWDAGRLMVERISLNLYQQFMTVTRCLLLALALTAVPLYIANSFHLTSAPHPQVQPSLANLIHVEIGGLRNDTGQVVCALFSSADGFPKKGDKAVAQTKSAISNAHAVCEFRDVRPARYAISVFHDENSNGKLDTNFMGIPREGVGASNNAKGHFGPPKFDAASFAFSGGRLELKITITYL